MGHLGVNVAGCIEKEEVVERLAASGTIELICDDATQDRFTSTESVPESCKITSAHLGSMSVNEIRQQMVQMGIDITACYEKRGLIQRLIAAGRVATSRPGASESATPLQARGGEGELSPKRSRLDSAA